MQCLRFPPQTGKHSFIILCPNFLANRDPAGAVCKIDQICWPPCTARTSAQRVTIMRLLSLNNTRYIQHVPSPISSVSAQCFSRLRSSTMDLVTCQPGSMNSVLRKGKSAKTLVMIEMDWQSWSHHGFVSGTVLYTCGLDSVHKTLMRRRLAWKTQFEEDATEPRLQH